MTTEKVVNLSTAKTTQNTPPEWRRTMMITFKLIVGGKATRYQVTPLSTDEGVVKKAWRFRKLADVDETAYDVMLGEYGYECDCLGFLRWARCKHVAALRRFLGE